MQTVIETPNFIRHAKALGLTDSEIKEIIDRLAAEPEAGNEIKGTGGARKIRFAGRGKGKNGGYRIIHFFSGNMIPIFLLDIYSKGERIDLTVSEKNHLKKYLKQIVEEYRSDE